jgi:hypothetical protein
MYVPKQLALCCAAALGLLAAPAHPAKGTPGIQATAYHPPKASRKVLGNIVKLLKSATPIDREQFSCGPPNCHAATFIATLPDGELYFEVPGMDVDDDGIADGSPQDWTPRPVYDGTEANYHQNRVSYTPADRISAFEVAYIALPGGAKQPDCAPTATDCWWRNHGLAVGDAAVVIRGNRRIDAVFADVSPATKIGEMSIEAHELFGEKVIVNGSKAQRGPDGKPLTDPKTGKLLLEPALVTRDSESKGPFIVIVFPKTSVGRDFTNVCQSLSQVIESRFGNLAYGGSQNPPQRQSAPCH